MTTFSIATQPIQFIGRTDAQTTGLSRYARTLYDHLVKAGVAVSVVGAPSLPLPGLAYMLAHKAGFDLRTFFSTYPLRLPTLPKDAIVHLLSQGQASALAWQTHRRSVVTVHDMITSLYRHDPALTGYMRPYDKFFDAVAVRGLKRAAMLIAVSEHTRQDVIRYTGYPAERIVTIYEGVDHAVFHPQSVPSAFYDRYQLPRDGQYILYLGSEDPRKNLNRLLVAFRQVAVRFPDARLLKVGGGRFVGERQNLLAKVKDFGIIDKVHIIDQISDSDLAYFYNLADVFVFPSLYEGFGLPPLEAMACGTPVVCSAVSSLPEVVADAALLVDPYDTDALAAAIERVLSDSALRLTLRARSLHRAALFTWERTVLQTLDVYHHVMSNV